MKSKILLIFSVFCLLALGIWKLGKNTIHPNSTPMPPKEVSSLLQKLPLFFEENKGQSDSKVKFLTRGKGYGMYLTPSDISLSLSTGDKENLKHSVLQMSFVGGNKQSILQGEDELEGKSHYFNGKDKSEWKINVPHFAKVKYEQVYPGIDVVFYGNAKELEYDLVVNQGADPSKIELAFQGAEKLKIDEQGNLILKMGEGREVIQKVPVIYQEIEGNKKFIPGKFVIKEKNHVAFQVAQYDATQKLIIDPFIEYSTYWWGNGGNADFFAQEITVDDQNNIYVTGNIYSPNFQTTPTAFQTYSGGYDDAFVTKINANGTLAYSSYLGGKEGDYSDGIALDSKRNIYITGYTYSLDFPITPNAFQNSFKTNHDLPNSNTFVTKLNSDGTLAYSTFLGGNGFTYGYAIAVDGQDNIYVTGTTESNDFPVTPNAIQRTQNLFRSEDAFITKFNADGSLAYSTYLGGNRTDWSAGIAVDSQGNMYVTGWTTSSNFPVTSNAFQSTLRGDTNAFITKLNSNGSFAYSTYLGGSALNLASGIAVDSQENMYVTGSTSSPDFPIAQFPIQSSLRGGRDAFVTKFYSNGTLAYSTYLGGEGNDDGYGIVLDSQKNVYVTGATDSSRFFPLTTNALQHTFGGGEDAFIAKLNNPDGSLNYSTYLGVTDFEASYGIAVDSQKNIYVTGRTESSNFPVTPNALIHQSVVGAETFITKISSSNCNLSVDPNYQNVCIGLSCNETSSTIIRTPANEGMNCTVPSIFLTGSHNGVCRSGTCTPAVTTIPPPAPLPTLDLCVGKVINDNNACTVDYCDPKTGKITHTSGNENMKCDDLNPCTTNDVCKKGICTGIWNSPLDPSKKCQIY